MHEQSFEFLLVGDQELAETIRQHELGLLVVAVANLGHRAIASELPAHAVVDAVRATPVGSQALELVALEALELRVVLLYLRQTTQRHHHPFLLPGRCCKQAPQRYGGYKQMRLLKGVLLDVVLLAWIRRKLQTDLGRWLRNCEESEYSHD